MKPEEPTDEELKVPETWRITAHGRCVWLESSIDRYVGFGFRWPWRIAWDANWYDGPHYALNLGFFHVGWSL